MTNFGTTFYLGKVALFDLGEGALLANLFCAFFSICVLGFSSMRVDTAGFSFTARLGQEVFTKLLFKLPLLLYRGLRLLKCCLCLLLV